MEVIAVVVTRDRLDLLKGSLSCLMSQSVPLKKIVVIDNASSDGTTEFLKENTIDIIDCIFSETNEGGAGGFYRGIKRAYEIGCDAVWIMDDDTYPTQTALEELISDYRYLQSAGAKVGFITSNALFKDGKPCLMNVSNPEFVWNEHIKHGLVRVKHSSFVSMMIPTYVVADLGLPVKEFFIWGDDGEYSTRIAAKYEGYMSGNSTVYHMMKENVGVDIFTIPKDRINRFYYFYRNWMFTSMSRGKEEEKNFVKGAEHLIKMIKKSNTPYKKEKIETIRKGIADGRKFHAKIEKVHPLPEKESEEKEHQNHQSENKYIKIIGKRVIQKWPNTDYGYVQFQFNRYKRISDKDRSDFKFLRDGLNHSKIYDGENRSSAFKSLMNEMDIKPIIHGTFVTSIDYYKNWCILFRQMDNAPVDYDLVINCGIKELYLNSEDGFSKENDCVLDGICDYITRLKEVISKTNNPNKETIVKNLDNMLHSKATTIEDALQRIIIITQILWQTGHYLVGMGRLDYILDEIIKSDARDDETITQILDDFIKTMHEYYWYKSSALMGDTGQIIILGGSSPTGDYFENRLTYLFIDSIKRCKLPDPKILLRISSKTPRNLINSAVECIGTGIGSPLLANDDVIIPRLIKFGYDAVDAYNYTTSACWEPIPGNSFEQNNIAHINFVEPFKLVSEKEVLSEISTFEEYLHLYENHLYGHSEFIFNSLNGIVWEFDPVVSAFLKPCRDRKTDVSIGGEKYNNYGVLTNGLSNAVNSLLTMKKLVFVDKKYTLREFDQQLIENYPDDILYNEAINNSDYFGHDDNEIIHLTNELLYVVSDAASHYKNKFGGTVKIGTSSPSYISLGSITRASFDGRKEGDPFGVHISAKGNTPYTELFNFASKISIYDNTFNGNVVDVVVTPNLINDNKETFIDLIKSALDMGFFETQFNVLSADVLKDAYEHPDNYPDLIVRVWGFSAYFIDLPEDYQLLLIQRAEECESCSY